MPCSQKLIPFSGYKYSELIHMSVKVFLFGKLGPGRFVIGILAATRIRGSITSAEPPLKIIDLLGQP
jgi:hypothetical protein